MTQLFLIVLNAICFLGFLPVGQVAGQTAVPVTISVRSADGSPVVGTEVTLLSQPDYTAQTAVTNASLMPSGALLICSCSSAVKKSAANLAGRDSIRSISAPKA